MNLRYLNRAITLLQSLISPADDDQLLIVDTSANVTKRVTVAELRGDSGSIEGTANTLAKFTPGGVGDSRISDDGDLGPVGVSVDLTHASEVSGFNVSTPNSSLAVEVAGPIEMGGTLIHFQGSNGIDLTTAGANFNFEIRGAEKTFGIGDTNGDGGATTIVVDDAAQTITLNAANGVIINVLKEYVALLSQSGTNAPVATVLRNTLGGAVVWARASEGIFTATLSGAFPPGKTAPFTNGSSGEDQNSNVTLDLDTNDLTFSTLRLVVSVEWGLTDGAIARHPVRIEVYP